MRDKQLDLFKQKMAEKWITKNGKLWKKKKEEKSTNTDEVNKKNNINCISLFEIKDYTETYQLNKKKFRDIKIQKLKNHIESCLWDLKIAIALYKELKDKTEYWERKSIIDFNFKDWNKLKKVNGKITKYYKELLEVQRSLENEKN